MANPELAGLLAIESARAAPTAQAEDALRTVLAHPARATLRGHTGRVNTAAFSPDGRWLLTASADGTARVWEVSSHQTARELVAHRREVTSAAFSPDGRWIATASDDQTTLVWEVGNDATPVAEVRGSRVSVTDAFSPDGTCGGTVAW
jgi:WD40 repeat protein